MVNALRLPPTWTSSLKVYLKVLKCAPILLSKGSISAKLLAASSAAISSPTFLRMLSTMRSESVP